NKSILPIALFKIKGNISFLTYDIQDNIKLKGYLNSKGATAISYQLLPLYRGLLQLNLREIKIYDYLGLFSFKQQISITKTSVVSPRVSSLTIEAQRHMLYGESDEFSSEVSGDDVSEVFRVREYAPGDRIKAIHWKISSRSKNLVVRDFSQPIINNIVIAADFKCYYNSDIENIACVDKVAEISLQLAAALLNNGVNSTIIWYSKINKDLLSLNINNTMDYEIAQTTLSAEKLYVNGIDFADMLKIFTGENENNNKLYCVLSKIEGKTKETILDLITNGKADINLHYIKKNLDDDQQNNIKSIRESSVVIKEYAPPDYKNKFDKFIKKLTNIQQNQINKSKLKKTAEKKDMKRQVNEN
ncbi:MAG: DUF58 domain-containing protein, partial [Oscillospiraceae bacterium]